MKLLINTKQRSLALVSTNFALLFHSVPDSNQCSIEFIPIADLKKSQYKPLTTANIHGFLGLIEVNGNVFICGITSASKVAVPVPGESVQRIYGVDFYCLNNPVWDFVELDSSGFPILPDEDPSTAGPRDSTARHPCHELKKLLSTGGFYYSSDFDLTKNLQARGLGEHSLSVDDFNKAYMWNSFMLEEIINFRDKLESSVKEKLDDEGFLTTVIRGFAKTTSSYMNGSKCNLSIISKQSWERAGTRYNARGIDDEANVANFVETELILYSEDWCYSYSQIRGSIPLFWEQDTALINPKVQITRSKEATQPVFNQHFDKLINDYKSVNVVNLLSTKTNELPLTRRYKEHLDTYNHPEVLYSHFDFHRETSDKGFSAASKIYQTIKDSLYLYGYFSDDLKKAKQESLQSGVFRTNCLDCLDRTNLIQQFVSNFALTIFLKDHDIYIPQESEFFNAHNSLWADNGDQISQIYTGTNALKSSFSRSGKMSFAGALSDATKSVSRLYINNFMDKGKQNTIDMLLGRLNGQIPVRLYDPISDHVNTKLLSIQDQYTSNHSINVFAGTFNVNACTRVQDLSPWLYPIGEHFKPNVVVLGFQEVIELNAGSILNADYTRSGFWTAEVDKILNLHDKYLMIRAEQMSSLLLLFFVRDDCIPHVKNVEGANKKTGLGGMTGNKGAVAIKFNYGATKFCFVNAHLAAGTDKIMERNADVVNIIDGVKFTRGNKIHDNDYCFWLGDLNYRIDLKNDVVRSKIKSQDYEYLIQHDQLTKEIDYNRAFKGYSEPSLNFKPTYKFDKGTDLYDTSEKQRVPSWTDRIIYKGHGVKPLAYSSVEKIMISDHKPVYAAYKANVQFIDEDKKLALSKQFYEDFKSKHDVNDALIDFGHKSLPTKEKSMADIPNLLDEDLDNEDGIENKPALPKRDFTTQYEVLTPTRNNTPTPQLPKRPTSTASLSGPAPISAPKPQPPAPRSSHTASSNGVSSQSGSVQSSSASASTTPPPVPSPRKSVLPPGYSDMILQPRSRSMTPSNSTSSTPKIEAPTLAKPTNVSKKPTIPKKPESLSSSQSTVPIIPKKPQTLRSQSSKPNAPQKTMSLQNLKPQSVTPDESKTLDNEEKLHPSVDERARPTPPPSRNGTTISDKTMDTWTPLVPK